eukprot:g26836.t1
MKRGGNNEWKQEESAKGARSQVGGPCKQVGCIEELGRINEAQADPWASKVRPPTAIQQKVTLVYEASRRSFKFSLHL